MIDFDTEGPRSAKYLRRLPLSKRRHFMDVPKPLEKARLSQSDRPEVEDVRTWVENYDTEDIPAGQGLRLHGPSGSGKSYLAVAALKYLMQNYGLSGAFVSTISYLDMVFADIRGDQPEGPEIAAGHHLLYLRKRYDVVVLDGLGEERRTQQSDSILYELMRQRYEQGYTTIYTSALPLKELAARYGEPCIDFLERTTNEIWLR